MSAPDDAAEFYRACRDLEKNSCGRDYGDITTCERGWRGPSYLALVAIRYPGGCAARSAEEKFNQRRRREMKRATMTNPHQDGRTLTEVLRSADQGQGKAEVSEYVPPEHRAPSMVDAAQAVATVEREVGNLSVKAAQENQGTPEAALVAAEEVSSFIAKAAEFIRKSADNVMLQAKQFVEESHKLADEFDQIGNGHAEQTIGICNHVKEMTLGFQDLRDRFVKKIDEEREKAATFLARRSR